MVLEILNKLRANGELCELVDAGIVSPKIMGYHEMWMQYDINTRVKGMKSTAAKCEVCNIFNCDIRTVERAIKAVNR